MRSFLLAFVLAAAPLAACPACKNATPTKRAGEGMPVADPKAVSRGFNYSIYFMLSMVYGVPTVLGLALWRTVSAHQARRRTARARGIISSPIEMYQVPAREEAGS